MEVINLSYRCGTCIYFDSNDKKGCECRCLLNTRKYPYRFRTDKCSNYVEDEDKPKIVPKRKTRSKKETFEKKMNEMKAIKKDLLSLVEEMNKITEAYLIKIKEVCDE